VTPDPPARPGEPRPADGSDPRRLAARIGSRPPLVAGCLLCTVASMLAVRVGPDAGYRTVVLPVAVLFGFGLASLLPPQTATAMNTAPDSLAGLASGVNNAVARVAGLLWIAALTPITSLTGETYTDPARFRSSFGQTEPPRIDRVQDQA
jgi:MFS family permease